MMENTEKSMQTLGVTSNPRSQLEGLCAHTFKLAWAGEKSTVMTRSFTAIPAHLMGTAVGLRKGLNPDAPKNLTRAVVLSPDRNRPAKRRGA
jgi:glucosamine 6-phosphate synthetase-like amidotransferase/phosphosugar isomerase protein